MNKIISIYRCAYKFIKYIILGFLFILISAFIYNKYSFGYKTKEYLNDIIKESINKEDRYTYLDIEYIMTPFASYNDKSNFYIVKDNDYFYIVYLKNSTADKLLKEDLKQNPKRINGVTKNIPDDIKTLAINSYNDLVAKEEYKINEDNFYELFGDIYLDETKKYISRIDLPLVLLFIFFTSGLFITSYGIISIIIYKKSLKTIDTEKLDKVIKELNNNLLYGKKNDIYLTDNYLIIISEKCEIYEYSEILWMHTYEQSFFVNKYKYIKLFTSDAKFHLINRTNEFSKSKIKSYKEIWNIIANKNDNIRLGYTKNNIKYFKEKYKEMKKYIKIKRKIK